MIFLCILFLAGCSKDDGSGESTSEVIIEAKKESQPETAAKTPSDAASLRRAVESAVENGDTEDYQEALKDLYAHMDTLTEEELRKFYAQWEDPPLTNWTHLMSFQLIYKSRMYWLDKKQPGATEPIADTVTYLVKGVLGSQNTLPRIRELRIHGSSLELAYRTYGTSVGRTGRLAELQDIGLLLKYLAAHEPLKELENFQIEAYQDLTDAGGEELVMRVRLDRGSIDKLPWTGHISTRLAETAGIYGSLWIHQRFQGSI
jgi:hypothetical protein